MPMAKPIISTQILGCLKPGCVWSSGILSTKQAWWLWERVPNDSIGMMLHLSRKIKFSLIFPVISFMLLCFWMFWGVCFFVHFFFNLLKPKGPFTHHILTSCRFSKSIASRFVSGPNGRRELFLFFETYIDVSENGGTPKSSILIGFSIVNHPFWGTPIFGNPHIWRTGKRHSLKLTAFSHPKFLDGWNTSDCFLLGPGLVSGVNCSF